LAGGLARELNNLLMGIQGRASLLSLALGKANPLQTHIEQMELLIIEAAKLSKQLVGFAQCGKYHLEQLNLNLVAEAAVAALNCSAATR
jgi:two-component system, cell cycle sensor histidine kinase and response regulator CckA